MKRSHASFWVVPSGCCLEGADDMERRGCRWRDQTESPTGNEEGASDYSL